MRKKQQIDFIVGMQCYATKNNDQQEGTLTKINKELQNHIESTWKFPISESCLSKGQFSAHDETSQKVGLP